MLHLTIGTNGKFGDSHHMDGSIFRPRIEAKYVCIFFQISSYPNFSSVSSAAILKEDGDVSPMRSYTTPPVFTSSNANHSPISASNQMPPHL